MKVLIVSAFDLKGGAGKAALRLHKGLLEKKVDSFMYVQYKNSNEKNVFSNASFLWKIKNYISIKLNYYILRLFKKKKDLPFYSLDFFSGELLDVVRRVNPDILHLHWICNSFVNMKDLAKIDLPILWTLHDMWPFTGGCHHSDGCLKYQEECSYCPMLSLGIKKDFSNILFLKKKKVFDRLKMKIIGLSAWICGKAKSSELFKNLEIINLPNPIDCSVFKYNDSLDLRNSLNPKGDKVLILMGSADALDNKRKGSEFLSEILQAYPFEKYKFVVIGNSSSVFYNSKNADMVFLGDIKDEDYLAKVYSSVDLFIMPSKEENLSNMIMECLACGTPVVAFDIGGNSDMITHKVNGYLSDPFSLDSLSAGVDFCLANLKGKRASISEDIKRRFSTNVIMDKYIALYKKIMVKK